MSEFLKIGKKIIVDENNNIVSYELEAGKIYDIKFDHYDNPKIWLVENGDFNMPGKVYSTKEDDRFVNRVLRYFEKTTKQTTGVLLNGTKGTGKTVICKRIAIESKLPIIVVNDEFPAQKLLEFFKKIKTPVCIFIDEIEKTQNTQHLLTFLDGVEATCKKLVLMTSNTTANIDGNLFDRPSRVRYYRTFETTSLEFLEEILKDRKIVDKDNKIKSFIATQFSFITIDNIMALLDEIEMFGFEDLHELIKFLNITPKPVKGLVVNEKCEEDCEFDNLEELLEDLDN